MHSRQAMIIIGFGCIMYRFSVRYCTCMYCICILHSFDQFYCTLVCMVVMQEYHFLVLWYKIENDTVDDNLHVPVLVWIMECKIYIIVFEIIVSCCCRSWLLTALLTLSLLLLSDWFQYFCDTYVRWYCTIVVSTVSTCTSSAYGIYSTWYYLSDIGLVGITSGAELQLTCNRPR